jgi:hypothetical protein
MPGAELLNVGGHGAWSAGLHGQASFLAPVEELPDGNGANHPGVPIADVGREEIDEALAGSGTSRCNRGRQSLKHRQPGVQLSLCHGAEFVRAARQNTCKPVFHRGLSPQCTRRRVVAG